MPASLGSVTVDVGNSDWAAVNQKIFIGAGASRGTFEVTAKPSATQLTLTNLETASAYTDNSPAGTVFPVGSIVSPSGLQGEAGSAAAGALLSANNLSDVANAATSRTNLGLGTAAVLTAGIANGNLAPVSLGGGLIAGRSVWAVAGGLETKTQLAALAALGVILGTSDTNVAPVNDAAFTAGEVVFATATGIETKSAALARTALGIAAATKRALYEYQLAPATLSGAFTSGAQRVVPLNTEVFDADNIGTLAANQVTLAAGTYRFRAWMIGYRVDDFQCLLYNATDATVIKYGNTLFTPNVAGLASVSQVEGNFTIAGAKAIEIRAQCTTTNATTGFGPNLVFGTYDVKAALEIEQDA